MNLLQFLRIREVTRRNEKVGDYTYCINPQGEIGIMCFTYKLEMQEFDLSYFFLYSHDTEQSGCNIPISTFYISRKLFFACSNTCVFV